MTRSNPRIPLANANSSTALLIHTTVKGINKTLLRCTESSVFVLIHQSTSSLHLALVLAPLHTLTLPHLHFERRLILAPMLLSPHGPTPLPAIPFPSRARIPPDTLPSPSIHPRAPKPHPSPAQCRWIRQRLVVPLFRILLIFLLPFLVTFLWNFLQIPLLNQPTLPSVCDWPSLPSLVLPSMVPIHGDVNVIRQNPPLLPLSSKIQFL